MLGKRNQKSGRGIGWLERWDVPISPYQRIIASEPPRGTETQTLSRAEKGPCYVLQFLQQQHPLAHHPDHHSLWLRQQRLRLRLWLRQQQRLRLRLRQQRLRRLLQLSIYRRGRRGPSPFAFQTIVGAWLFPRVLRISA